MERINLVIIQFNPSVYDFEDPHGALFLQKGDYNKYLRHRKSYFNFAEQGDVYENYYRPLELRLWNT